MPITASLCLLCTLYVQFVAEVHTTANMQCVQYCKRTMWANSAHHCQNELWTSVRGHHFNIFINYISLNYSFITVVLFFILLLFHWWIRGIGWNSLSINAKFCILHNYTYALICFGRCFSGNNRTFPFGAPRMTVQFKCTLHPGLSRIW